MSRTCALLCVLALSLLIGLPGCGSPVAAGVGLAVGATAIGAHSPAQEIEQIYYLGVFDPQEQIPQAVYRIRVHGQASALSSTKFASGWVPSNLIDTLNTHISLDNTNGVVIKGSDKADQGLKTGRRLVMFGPEGFREAPRDHRLVIVMGTSPDKFFGAIGSSMEAITEVQLEQAGNQSTQAITGEMLRIHRERTALRDLSHQLELDAAKAATK